MSPKPLIKVLSLLGIAGALCAFTPSCRDNNETIFIRQIQLPASPGCITKNDPTAAAIERGVLDVALRSRYSTDVLVGNQLVARGDFKQTRAEPNRVLFKGADIHLVDIGAPNAPELGFYSVTAVGEADPQTNGDAGYGIASFDLIPPGVAVGIAKTLRSSLVSGADTVQSFEARFKIYGTTLGGTDVESGEYAFQIDVCYGCTVQFSSDATDPSLPLPNCSKAGTPTASTTGPVQACLAGQDGVTDCRLCQGTLVCQPCAKDDTCTAIGGTKCVSGHCV